MSEISEIRYVAYEVPDFAGERAFYREPQAMPQPEADKGLFQAPEA